MKKQRGKRRATFRIPPIHPSEQRSLWNFVQIRKNKNAAADVYVYDFTSCGGRGRGEVILLFEPEGDRATRNPTIQFVAVRES